MGAQCVCLVFGKNSGNGSNPFGRIVRSPCRFAAVLGFRDGDDFVADADAGDDRTGLGKTVPVVDETRSGVTMRLFFAPSIFFMGVDPEEDTCSGTVNCASLDFLERLFRILLEVEMAGVLTAGPSPSDSSLIRWKRHVRVDRLNTSGVANADMLL
eukprot:scaffold41710_cov55-Attheya_sp.AAC.2